MVGQKHDRLPVALVPDHHPTERIRALLEYSPALEINYLTWSARLLRWTGTGHSCTTRYEVEDIIRVTKKTPCRFQAPKMASSLKARSTATIEPLAGGTCQAILLS